MKREKKILFAIADKDTEEYLATVIKEDCPNCSIIGIVTYKEKLIPKVSQLEPDIIILRETLPGSLSITDILFELRYSYPNARVIFLGGDRAPGDPLLLTLVTYGVYDLLIGGSHKISDVIELINKPNEFKDINYLIPKASLNELTNTMHFESPLVVSTKKQDIFVVEDKKINRMNQKKSFFNKSEDIIQEDYVNNNDDLFNIDIDIEDINSHNNKSFNTKNNSSNNDDLFNIEFDVEDKDLNNDDLFNIELDVEDKDLNNDDLSNIEFDLDDKDLNNDDLSNIEFDIEDIGSNNDELFDIKLDADNNKSDNDESFDIEFEIEDKPYVLESEDDFLLDIDINDIKDNKDKSIDDILFECESNDDDIISFENNSNNKYENKTNVDKYKITNNIPSYKNNDKNEDTLEDLSKEIEKIREDTFMDTNIFDEKDLNTTNHSRYNNSDNKYKEDTNLENTNQSLSFKTVLNKNSKQSKEKSSRQKIISFLGGKNGIGTSSIAINTAVNLAKQGKKVIYIEMNAKHPTIGYWYQIGHINQGIETAIKAVEKEELHKIDKSIIKSVDLKNEKRRIYKNLPEKLDFLLFSKQETILKNKEANVKPELLKDLLLSLMIELNYDFVILDLDFDLNNKYTTTCISFSNIIYPIVTQDISTLAYLVFKLEELERFGKNIKNKCRYIINKYESNGVKITLRDLKEWLGSKNIITIPENNKEFINANSSSIPVINYTRNEKIIKSFNDITRDILSDDF